MWSGGEAAASNAGYAMRQQSSRQTMGLSLPQSGTHPQTHRYVGIPDPRSQTIYPPSFIAFTVWNDKARFAPRITVSSASGGCGAQPGQTAFARSLPPLQRPAAARAATRDCCQGPDAARLDFSAPAPRFLEACRRCSSAAIRPTNPAQTTASPSSSSSKRHSYDSPAGTVYRTGPGRTGQQTNRCAS